jgi:hypothetical protein
MVGFDPTHGSSSLPASAIASPLKYRNREVQVVSNPAELAEMQEVGDINRLPMRPF